MYKNGVFFGKMIPPHRGHLYQIISASTQCEHLYVVVTHSGQETAELCGKDNLPYMPLALRRKWLAQELQTLEHVTVLSFDEDNFQIPPFPFGWDEWMKIMIEQILPVKPDAFFVGEKEYKTEIQKRYPEIEVEVFDYGRSKYPISATDIRRHPMKHWDYILGPARPFFAKKVLLAGTESTGKSSLTLKLAKLYYTSWSEEVGRYYAKRFLGGDETIFEDSDFARIAALQNEQDLEALRTSNKVVFFDTDATYTQYFSELYLGEENEMVEAYIDPTKYDAVLYLRPDVPWVDDGMRLNGEQQRRLTLDRRLYSMYCEHGFGNKLYSIGGSYSERLRTAINIVDKLMKD